MYLDAASVTVTRFPPVTNGLNPWLFMDLPLKQSDFEKSGSSDPLLMTRHHHRDELYVFMCSTNR